MDRMLYVAMNGAKQIMQAQTVNGNNLANINTSGFRSDLVAFSSLPVQGPGYESRVYTRIGSGSTDMSPGAVSTTERELDVALEGDGWITVQGPDGKEGYTRAGNLNVSVDGLLETGTGYAVMADGGPITVPPYQKLEIGADGTVSVVPLGQSSAAQVVVGRIKLVNPPKNEMVKGDDGLFRLKDGRNATPEATLRLLSGSLEGSNVNAADAMASMIELSRQFEMHTKLMRAAEENDAASAKLMTMG